VVLVSRFAAVTTAREVMLLPADATVIETPRLTLRPPLASDVETMMLIHQDPDVMRYLGSGVSGDLAAAWRNVAMMIGHWHMRGYGPWVVVGKESGEILGRAGLWNPEGNPGVELGWMMRRSAWGRNYATEAARSALDWAWRHTNVDHIISVIRAENAPSIRIAEKLGERLEATETKDGMTVYTFGIHRSASVRIPPIVINPPTPW
jgi:RimJ/RimL family protein N-acetyltransferase